MEVGDWRLEIGNWRLEIGNWRLDAVGAQHTFGGSQAMSARSHHVPPAATGVRGAAPQHPASGSRLPFVRRQSRHERPVAPCPSAATGVRSAAPQHPASGSRLPVVRRQSSHERPVAPCPSATGVRSAAPPQPRLRRPFAFRSAAVKARAPGRTMSLRRYRRLGCCALTACLRRRPYACALRARHLPQPGDNR